MSTTLHSIYFSLILTRPLYSYKFTFHSLISPHRFFQLSLILCCHKPSVSLSPISMAEVSLKRHRDAAADVDGDCTETQPQIIDSESEPKKQKSINHILSILEQDEDEPDHDLTSLMSSLENEIISTLDFDSLPIDGIECEIGFDGSTPSMSPESKSTADEDEKERVIRHLLEASDDELGLPANKSTDEIGDGVVIDGGDSFGICEGLWELEDEAANYYTLLQSELFM